MAVGLIYAVVYYFVFKYVIERFDVKTPGRTTIEEDAEEDVIIASDDNLGATILSALGGRENVAEIDNCISRLRLVLKDTSVVNERLLASTGSMGLVKIDQNNIQVVYGGKVEKAAQSLKKEIRAQK